MINGNYLQKKKNYIFERFKTQEGLFEFFTATAVWYFLIVKFVEQWNAYILEWWLKMIPIRLVAQYLTYLSLSIIFTAISFGVSYILIKLFQELKRRY